jgi:hypothetical protein
MRSGPGRSVGRGPSDTVGLQRAMAARAQERRRDSDGSYRMRLRELAVARGLVPGALIDEWNSRADARACWQSPDDAERCALADIEGA